MDDAFGFALTWNYWFNDAVSTATDHNAHQKLTQKRTDKNPGRAISQIIQKEARGEKVRTGRDEGEAEETRRNRK